MSNVYCKNHPEKKALSICHNCGEYYCGNCLEEGLVYYYCRKPECYSFIENEINIYEKEYAKNPRFCEKCIEETNSESTGSLSTINFIGSTLHSLGGVCPTCRSIVVEKRWIFLGIPIRSKGFYRAIYLSHKNGFSSSSMTFISRKLKNQKIDLQNI